jgi:hypothetical protein
VKSTGSGIYVGRGGRELLRLRHLILYHFFRFERATQNIISSPILYRLTSSNSGRDPGLKRDLDEVKSEVEKVLNNPVSGTSLSIASAQLALVLFAVMFSLVNLVVGFVFPSSRDLWLVGLVACVVISFLASSYGRKEAWRNDFTYFESWPPSRRRWTGLLVLLFVFSTYLGCFLSFLFYLRASVTY